MYEPKVPDYMLKREKGKEIGVRTQYFLIEVAGTSRTGAGSCIVHNLQQKPGKMKGNQGKTP
jgi:hypothetical protein